jgi:hypothetical protein
VKPVTLVGIALIRGADMSLTTGVEHSPTSATGTRWERTPWRATQRPAWALKAREQDCVV